MLSHSDTEVLVCVASFRSRDYRETLRELVPELASAEWSSERFPALRDVVVVGEAPELPGVKTLADVMAAGKPFAPVPVSAADDAFILYTSGSSARPKAVPMQHYGTIENGFSIGERMGLEREDRVFVSVPLFWAYGAVNALPATLTHGAALVLQAAFEPRGALELIERHRCTAIYTLPNMSAALARRRGLRARARGVPAHRPDAGHRGGDPSHAAGARCSEDLQHLRRHRDLRQLLRDAQRLARRAPADEPGTAASGCAAADRRPRQRRAHADGRGRRDPGSPGTSPAAISPTTPVRARRRSGPTAGIARATSARSTTRAACTSTPARPR